MRRVVSVGFAMFAMFFGAGNIVFPLLLGRDFGSQNLYAMLGLLVTAVIVPFMGLIGMILFKGDYKSFFGRMGPFIGFLVACIIMILIGPFAGIPRCIALSYSNMKIYFPNLHLWAFVAVACGVLFLLAIKKNKIVDYLGYVLTPFLLCSLIVILAIGFYKAPSPVQVDVSPVSAFVGGLKIGYNTLDLLAAFFFSTVVLFALRRKEVTSEVGSSKGIVLLALQASILAGCLLGAIYVGFSFLSSFYGSHLSLVPQDELLSTISDKVLGPHAGIIVNVAISLACLTTALTLSAVFSEFVSKDLFKRKIGYKKSLCITLVIAFIFANLGFSGIIRMIAPILYVIYPALIALSILNITYKLFHFRPIKFIVFTVFVVSIFSFMF